MKKLVVCFAWCSMFVFVHAAKAADIRKENESRGLDDATMKAKFFASYCAKSQNPTLCLEDAGYTCIQDTNEVALKIECRITVGANRSFVIRGPGADHSFTYKEVFE